MKTNFKGVFPALTTKFKSDESIDFPAMARSIELQLDADVHGIILCGTLGEAGTLTPDEKIGLLHFTKKLVNARVPVLINIAESRTPDALRFVKQAEDAGADGFMCLPPLRYPADERETLTYLSTIAASTNLPIMLYNNPVDYRIEVTLPMLEILSEFPNIVAIKESTRDVSNVTRMLNKFGDRFSIFCGVDTLALESLLMGAHGWVAGLVCAFPHETVAIYNLARRGETEKAREIYRWFLPLLELDIHPKLVQYIKLAETLCGAGTEFVRAPRLLLDKTEHARISGIIQKALSVRPQLNEPVTA